MKPLKLWLIIGSTLVSSLFAGAALKPHILESYLSKREFQIADIYQSAVLTATAGGAVGLTLALWITGKTRTTEIQQEALRLIERQAGRGDLTQEQRVALAYAAEDIQQSLSK